jgi:hypothetical protein
MKNIRALNQSGSAHVIIIVVLSVALVAALGFVFWQNFLQQKDTGDTSETQSSSMTKSEKKAEQEYKTFSSELLNNVSFQYPAEWTVKESAVGETDYQVVTITVRDEDNERVARLQTNGQLGGACETPTTYTTLDTVKADVTAVEPTNFSLTAAVDPDGGYQVNYGLTYIYRTLESGQVCPNMLFYVFDPGNDQMNGTAFGYDMVEQKHFESMDDIKTFIASDKYKAIKKMVLSLKTE